MASGGGGGGLSPAACEAVLSGPLVELPLRSFVEALSGRHGLQLTEREVERATQLLQEQWFTYAEELRSVDLEALQFLALPKQLPLAIHAYFSPSYNPQQKFPPLGGAPAASASPPPMHTSSASPAPSAASAGNGLARSSSAGLDTLAPPAASVARTPSPAHGSSAAGSEGGAKPDIGEANLELSVSRSSSGEGGLDGSSDESDDSGSEPSQELADDGDPSALPADAASGAASRRKKKKWDRHSSLVALSKAVDHVCASATRDEAVLSSLQNILRNAMAKSGRHTQNTLRELMKKLQDKHGEIAGDAAVAAAAPAAALDDLGARMQSLSVSKAKSSSLLSATPAASSSTSASSASALGAVSPSSASAISPAASPSHALYHHTCGLCHGAQDKPVVLQDCAHEFCRRCMSDYIMALVGAKKAVGITCPYTDPSGGSKCERELSTGVIQSVLSAGDFESYLNATLMSFIESDDCLTVACPNPKCGALMSVEPLQNREVSLPITEKDEEGRVLSKETYLHFREFRVRCRECNDCNFCAKCRATPYHKGFTCAGWKEYQASRHCRFCSAKLAPEEAAKLSNGVRDVCSDADCQAKSLLCCEKILPCGCACNGIRNEATCLGCLKHDLHVDEDEFCGICYVESLKDAPCIQLQGPCTHMFHYGCVVKKLESKWPNARIGFEFLSCPLCKQAMNHPSLTSILAPIQALEKDIQTRALQRLAHEGREKDPAIVNANGAFFGDPLAFAMKQYLFYMCYKCKRPYFAGGYACQEANVAFDPAELVCPGCQPQSVEDCPTHGRDWLAYKCRYCCSFANWYCWGTTHFCDKCHKSGVWQNLAVFRTGKNKKKIWEYEQCPSLVAPVAAIAAEPTTEDEKNAKLAKLLCAPRSCALGVRHPPNGLEFGLGCSMCEDRQSLGDAAQAAEAVRQKLLAVKSELAKVGTRKLEYSGSDFDTQGLFWYLGTCAHTQVWSNPAEAGFVKIGCSGAMEDSAPMSALVGRDLVRLVSKPVRNSWFSWELIELQLCLTHYTLKHYNSWDTECLRTWVLEGSNDGLRWENIVTHSNDAALDKKGATHTWKVDSHGRKYSQFRLTQTGRNSNNNFYLALSGSEFYGELSLAPPKPAGPALPPAAAPLLPMPPGLMQASAGLGRGLTFTPVSDFDERGIIHFLGTNFGKQPWRNPCDLGLVHVACSELAPGPPESSPASAVCGKEVVRCVSAAKPNQWFVIDLTASGKCVRPSHYSLRHYSSWDLEALRNWRFEGSVNGFEWVTLSVHANDASLDRKGATHTWALPGCQLLCTMFRIFQTGLNSNHHHYLACSGFEIYGQLEEVPPQMAQYQRQLAQNMRAPQQPLQQPMAPQVQQQQPVQQQPVLPLNLNQGLQPYQATPLPPASVGQLMPAFQASVPSLADSGLVYLRYQSDFDTNGVMHYLGTQGRRAPWRNPAEMGLVSVRMSELASSPPSHPASAIVGREVVRCCTPGKPDMFFIIDLRDKLLMPTHYSLKHYASWDTECLRNWTLEGSLDGVRWDLLRQHVDDRALNGKGCTATWPLLPTGRAYRLFRLTQTGHNSNSNFYLACSGFEAYGLLQLWPMDGSPQAKAHASAMQNAGWRGDTVDTIRQAQADIWRAAQSYRPPPQQQAAGGYPGAVAQLQQPQQQQLVPAPAAAAAAAASPAPIVRADSGPPPYREFSDGMEFVYKHDLDMNGVLYWLGTSRWTKPYVNPAELGVVQVTSVPLATAPRSEPASSIVGRSLCRCVTLPNRESWFVIELCDVWLRPTAYTLRHYDSWDTEALRDWKLQGSNDGKKWAKLLSHKKDESLERKGATKTWVIPKPKKSYKMFRLLQTGRNSNNHWYMALSSVEFYGKVYSFKK